MLKNPITDMKYEQDCDMLEICNQINNGVFGVCEAGSSFGGRCEIADKTIIMALSKIIEKLDHPK